MSGKRYYWLKLKDDFFGSKRIKKLRKMAGGDTYLIIYLKLLLLAMKSDGVLAWTGLEQNIADELALDIDEEPDNIKVTLSYLLSCGLAESSDDVNFFFPYSVENTGSESTSAQRMRNARAAQKNISSAHPRTLCAQCDGEKEINKEINLDIEEESTEDTPPQTEAEHCPFVKIKDLYHQICISYPKLRSIDGNRKKAIAARWRTYKNLEVFEELFTIAESSDFLKGNNDSNWSADFDWMMKPTNFSKILEGKYDNRDKPNKSQSKLKNALDVMNDLYKEAQEYDKNGNNESSIPDFDELSASRQIEG